ncbi:MAG: hypothetical protein QNK05_25430 [Myxococcota bacterium]|nr:hypothetical protein [Myxococcota bacterium]
MFTIEMLPAYEGDSLWIEYGDPDAPRAVLVDAGRKETYRDVKERILARNGAPLEVFVMTHIDDDHIYGAVPLLADGEVPRSVFKDIWYNGWHHLDPTVAHRPEPHGGTGAADDVLGVVSGEIFAALLQRGPGPFPWNEAWGAGDTIVVPETGPLPSCTLEGGLTLTLLSPGWTQLKALRSYWIEKAEDADLRPGNVEDAMSLFAERPGLEPDVLGAPAVSALAQVPFKSDKKEPNGSSIALLAEYDGHSVLLAGDAFAPVLETSIARLLDEREEEKLLLDAFKVSHHGSKGNTSPALLRQLDCRRYLISTNGKRHYHPDGEALARIVAENKDGPEQTELHFNFDTQYTRPWDDRDLKRRWRYKAFYPPESRRIDLTGG